MRSPIISIGHFIPANYIGNPLPEGVGGEKKKKKTTTVCQSTVSPAGGLLLRFDRY